jgi:hypothetical protein
LADSKVTRLSDSAVPPGEKPAQEHKPQAPVGQWPVRGSRWGLILLAILWLAWVGFLLWMMIL